MGVRWPVGYALLAYHFNMAGIDGEAISTIGLKDDGAGFSVANANAIMQSFIDDGVWSRQASTVQITGVTLASGPSHPGGPFFASNLVPVDGGEGPDQMIPNTTTLLRKTTALGGRAGRGRMYMPLLRQQYVNDLGQLDSTAAAALQVAFDNHLDTVVALGYLFYLFHDSAVAPTQISDVTLEGTVATQRGRLSR